MVWRKLRTIHFQWWNWSQNDWRPFLFAWIFPADISNWNRNNSMPDGFGFFAYGADGVLNGIILILFIFIAFDAMIMSKSMDFIGLPHSVTTQRHRNIQYFGQTIERTVFLINTILCLCSVGMVLALTIVQPIHLMVNFQRFPFYRSKFSLFFNDQVVYLGVLG